MTYNEIMKEKKEWMQVLADSRFGTDDFTEALAKVNELDEMLNALSRYGLKDVHRTRIW